MLIEWTPRIESKHGARSRPVDFSYPIWCALRVEMNAKVAETAQFERAVIPLNSDAAQ